MPQILIVEDERHTAEMLRSMIEKHPDCTVLDICDSIESAVAVLGQQQDQLDLLFLDIQLADGESFEIFDEIEVKVPVIFCTAFDDYILKAFKSNGIDYILKPFQESDVHQALAKFEQLRSALSKGGAVPNEGLKQVITERKKPQKTFLARVGEKMIPVLAQDIHIIVLLNGIVYLYTSKGERFPLFKKMEDLENALDPAAFFRINRQMIVNRSAIRQMEPYFNRKLILNLDFQVPEKVIVSRLKVTPFLEWIEEN